MAKRKKSGTAINPLSDARKAKQRSVDNDDVSTSSKEIKVEILSKADLKAKELWFRKSGSGYQLFVEYYAGQPKGIVYDENDEKNTSKQKNPTTKSNSQGKGLSRAAKRRKKKNTSQLQKEKEKKTTVEEEVDVSLSLPPLSEKFKQVLSDKPDCEHIISMLSYMSTALPLTLRIRHNSFSSEERRREAKDLISELKEQYSHLVRPVSYDPSQETIFQATAESNLSKFSLGKISQDLKALLVDGTTSGILARQELGSMLPVIALSGIDQLRKGSRVLDVCACPGSKTLQALEIVGKKGRIVANDVHPLRLDTLKEAVGRSGVSSRLTDRIRYVNYDATKFPAPKSGRLFDCIIADVPCSGDGTIRKDPHILPSWMPSISNSLHVVQLNILKRALKLVKVGGVVSFSTCSMNPIEDEAVVAAALKWGNRFEDDSVTLVDFPYNSLPGFKTRPGVKAWRVADYSFNEHQSNDMDAEDTDIEGLAKLRWYDNCEDAEKDGIPHCCPSLFPPHKEELDNMHIEKCARLLPQDNDNGGFFVALLKKHKEVTLVKE